MGSRSRARARAQASEAASQAAPAAGVARGESAPAGRVQPGPADRGAAGPAPRGAAGPGVTAGPPCPRTLTLAAAIEALEAVLVLAATILAGIDTARGRSYQLSSGIAITVIGVATAALLGLVAAGLRRPRRWTRTPALLTQLFTGIVGIYLLQGDRYGWGGPAILLALAGFVTLLAPPSTRALTAGLPQPADRHRRRSR